ncbi:hypothetical protein SprV_0200749200 [Sparganum proliferum]
MLVARRSSESTAATLENTLLTLGRKKRANRDADLSVKFMALQIAQAQETEQTLVYNLSSKQLTVTQTKVLQGGSSFNTTDADPVIFIASFESVLRQTGATDEAKDLLRHEVSSLLMSHRKTLSLLRDERKALRELKSDTEIVSLSADKGWPTVILDKVDYRDKALTLLNDMESHKVRDAASLKFLVVKALAVQTPSNLPRQNYYVGDGQTTAQDLIELMEHCLKTFFTFEGTTYEQINGTPMGSPISGFIAEAVLQKLERRLLEEYKPKFWARYVDDTFVIIDRDKINYYAEVLNSIIPDLQFTREEEVGDKPPFLDVLVCRQPNGKVATSVNKNQRTRCKCSATTTTTRYNTNGTVSARYTDGCKLIAARQPPKWTR